MPKICDFNMSEFIYKSHECYDPKGTKYYSSPELFNIEQMNTLNYFKCDIWSVGIALYFISEKDLPYEVPDDWAKGRLKINMKDKSLQRIVEKCTLAESKRRPTAKELLNDKYFEYDDEIENMFINECDLQLLKVLFSIPLMIGQTFPFFIIKTDLP